MTVVPMLTLIGQAIIGKGIGEVAMVGALAAIARQIPNCAGNCESEAARGGSRKKAKRSRRGG